MKRNLAYGWCHCATLSFIARWATCLLRSPFIDAGITVRTTTASTASPNCAAAADSWTGKCCNTTTQERTDTNCASLSFDLIDRKEKQKKDNLYFADHCVGRIVLNLYCDYRKGFLHCRWYFCERSKVWASWLALYHWQPRAYGKDWFSQKSKT